MKWTEPAYAKLNLTLDILGKLENGYHSLSMVMQSVSLCDQVTLIRGEGVSGLQVACGSGAPSGPENIVWRAAQSFFDYCGIQDRDALFQIEKRIPSQAGMGGGSSDGAAALRLLNRAYGTGLSPETLRQIGAGVGADVPFCVTGGTMQAQGIGERLTPLAPLPDCTLLLCKPPVGVSTPQAFRESDRAPAVPPKTPAMAAALASGELSQVAACLGNRFQEILPLPEIEEIAAAMRFGGALGACMTGSGSAVFGIFTEESAAQNTGEALRKWGQVWLARPVPQWEI
mgnify:CR=1 FL=1